MGEPIDLVSPEIDPNRPVGGGGIHIDDRTTDRDLTPVLDLRFSAIPEPDQCSHQLIDVELIATADHDRIDQLDAGPGPDWPDERWWNFVVRRLDDGAVIGRVEGTTYGEWGELAYIFGPSSWGHGFASEATLWLIGFLRGVGAEELWAAVHPENVRSVRLLQRLGFVAMAAPGRPIGSFDDGDLVFRLDASTPSSGTSSVTT